MVDIGKYRIEKKLGQGGMGIVYQCRDTEADRQTALKLLPQQLAANPVFLQRFKREVMTLKRLDHDNIVKVFDQGVHDGAPYYVMEYVEGVSLESLLEQSERLKPLRAIEIIRACTEALQHSHAVGVIHRDIKPANIMIADNGNIKLMDFGIAKVLDATRMTATQSVLGTVEFMSPEQSQGRHLDARSDLYSLGVVFYLCLTGRLPISGSNPSEIVIKLKTHQIEAPLEWLPDMSKNLSDLVMKMLEKEPDHRPESAQELIRELDRVAGQIETGFSGHGDASSRIISSARAVQTPFWRSPWTYAFLAAALVAALFIFRSPGKPEPNNTNTEHRSTDAAATAIRAAKRAKESKRYDFAIDQCNLVLKYFPESKHAKTAAELLDEIRQAQEENSTENDSDLTLPNTPENPAPAG